MVLKVLVLLLSLGYTAGSNPSYVFSAGRSSGQFCGASLFHVDLLLTTASCYGVFAEGVLMGGDALDGSDGYFFGVDVEFRHPDYVPGRAETNLMVVRLKSAASNFTEQVLNGDGHLPLDGADLVVNGFSRRADEQSLPELSNDVAAKKLDHTACAEKYSGANQVYIVDDEMFCSSTVDSNECHGNMGDPVLDGHGAQVGIVAGGSDCDTHTFPTLNVRVSAFKGFLRAAVCQMSNFPPDACREIQTSTASPTLAPTGLAHVAAEGNSYQTNTSESLPPMNQSTPTSSPVYSSIQPSVVEYDYASSSPTGMPTQAIGSAAPSEETQADAAFLETNTTTPGTNQAYVFSAGKTSGKFCGASLVHKDLLLTAASCYGVFAEGVLMGGSWLDGSDGYFFAIDREVKHPSYVPGLADNNLMIVKLKAPATNFSIQLLNSDQQMPSDGSALIINGFSRRGNEKHLPAITNDVIAQKIDHASCTSTYESSSGLQIADEKLICSSTYDPHRCHGNMGDPVINTQGTQVGIVAGGSECNTATYPTLSVRVSAFATFFRAAVCQLSSFPPESCTTGILTSTADTPNESSGPTNATDVSASSDTDPVPSLAPVVASSIQPSSSGSSSLQPSTYSARLVSGTPTSGVSSPTPTMVSSLFSNDIESAYGTVESGNLTDISHASVQDEVADANGTEISYAIVEESDIAGDNVTSTNVSSITHANVANTNETDVSHQAATGDEELITSASVIENGVVVANGTETPNVTAIQGSVESANNTKTSNGTAIDDGVAIVNGSEALNSTAALGVIENTTEAGSPNTTTIEENADAASSDSAGHVVLQNASSSSASFSDNVTALPEKLTDDDAATSSLVDVPSSAPATASKVPTLSGLTTSNPSLRGSHDTEVPTVTESTPPTLAHSTTPTVAHSNTPTVAHSTNPTLASAARSSIPTGVPTTAPPSPLLTETPAPKSLLMKAVKAVGAALPLDFLETSSAKTARPAASSVVSKTSAPSLGSETPSASPSASPVVVTPNGGKAATIEDTPTGKAATIEDIPTGKAATIEDIPADSVSDQGNATATIISSPFSGNNELMQHFMEQAGLGWWNKTKTWGNGVKDKYAEKCPVEDDCTLFGMAGSQYNIVLMGQCLGICDITKTAQLATFQCGTCPDTSTEAFDLGGSNNVGDKK